MASPDPPSAIPLQQPPPSSSSRRLPPPCWSPDETLALIHSYRHRWHSLGRGNLKANHWQEVADAISARCPYVSPPKTPIQCRHKMEKLRKRYRTEIQRANSLPLSPFNSSWPHFNLMDSMEKGLKQENDSDQEIKNGHGLQGSNARSLNNLYRNGFGGGFRIRIPTGFNIPQPQPVNQRVNPNLNYGTRVTGKKRERDPVVSAIKVMGDGFVKMEKMKMEMAKEIEIMRMEMEMKRTAMILESQHRIVEAFAKAVSEKNKA
ncbi:hypothetical protein TanjilG_26386 [Lupinus angustifolius]|uniref:Myb-like domain-containing protein n=1 Tax=Lupinus angustifolius TaxID=3871 RepID=A0A4P1R2U5_LUPAN|nr:PREDICTED: uncharacterized protein LOC109361965 [Lupinus angustifolius]OIW00049.1 hypothetical protein TanjilG_26386 [Lupinus angustifolius]